jgi:hypothetical protein
MQMDERHVTDQQQVLADLARQGADNRKETSMVVSTAASTAAWAVKIISQVDYNVYSVQPVVLGAAGTLPLAVGAATEAFNLAEPFLSQGALSAGTYALMFRVGDKNAFYAVP